MQHQMLRPGGDVARAAMAKAMPSVRVTQLPGPYLPPFLLFHLKILPPAHNRPSLLDSLPLPLPSLSSLLSYFADILSLSLSLSRLLSPPLSPLAAIPSVSPAVGAQLERRLSMRSRAFQPPKPSKQSPVRSLRRDSCFRSCYASLSFLFLSFFSSRAGTASEAALSLAESWTHYSVIYGHDSGSRSNSENPLVVSDAAIARATAASERARERGSLQPSPEASFHPVRTLYSA